MRSLLAAAALLALSVPAVAVQLSRPHTPRAKTSGDYVVCIGRDACDEAILSAAARCEGPGYVKIPESEFGSVNCCPANGGYCWKMDGYRHGGFLSNQEPRP